MQKDVTFLAPRILRARREGLIGLVALSMLLGVSESLSLSGQHSGFVYASRHQSAQNMNLKLRVRFSESLERSQAPESD